jgi:hypothetical protein
MAKAKSTETRISAKDIGALAMPDFCPKCFWIKRKAKQLPFQIFPGIFSSIDSWTKNVMHAYFDDHGHAPAFIPELTHAVRYLPVPHWSKFCRTDPATGIIVSGVVDDIYETANGKHIIPDYKTAKYTEGQDKLIPLYQAQLNGYAWVGENVGLNVTGLLMAYFEPVTSGLLLAATEHGAAMAFTVKSVPVEIIPGMIPNLLTRAKEILDMPVPPSGADKCKDCEKLDNLMNVAFGGHVGSAAA